MRRRAFCALLGSVAISPLSALAQTSKLPIIGFLSPNTRSAASPWTAAFVRRLRDLGWIEDRTVTIVYRWEDGRSEGAAEFVAELIRLKVDAIVTHGVPNIVAAKQMS
jgi:putative tryptophan/tyrosine transport system substrate-binding protein